MIHKIKSLYDNGNGLGKKAIARELGMPGSWAFLSIRSVNIWAWKKMPFRPV